MPRPFWTRNCQTSPSYNTASQRTSCRRSTWRPRRCWRRSSRTRPQHSRKVLRHIDADPASPEFTAAAHSLVATLRRAHSGQGGNDATWPVRTTPITWRRNFFATSSTTALPPAVVATTVGDRVTPETATPALATATAAPETTVQTRRRPGARTIAETRAAAAAPHASSAPRRRTKRRIETPPPK